ncbi:MAG: MFS transporter [Rhodospirillales bacterium]|nr:MAG: MFS transporter [Rhodospirillales bacterium]
MPLPRGVGAAIGTLIIATSIIQLANGFFTTFVSMRVALEAFEATLAGAVLSSFFAGFTIGAVRSDRIIIRIGHIRAYAAFAGMVAAATALMPLLVEPVAWIVLRAIVGFGCAGIFVTTESWLNAKAPTALRGRVFAIYMVGTFLALAAGQLLIGQVDITTAAPFNAIVTLFALGLVLVSVTRAEAPQLTPPGAPPYGDLLRAAPIAVIGVLLTGMITGTFYALVPAWMQGANIVPERIALIMFAAVLGGLLFQVPIGKLSDRLDRRRVLAGLGVGLAVAAVAVLFAPREVTVIVPIAVVLGGFMSTLYPVCVAHAHDRMPADRVVAVSGALILMSGIGSVLGPLIGTQLMAALDINGILYLIAGTGLILGAVAAVLSRVAEPAASQERTFEVLTPQAAPLAHDPGDPELAMTEPEGETGAATEPDNDEKNPAREAGPTGA